MASWREEIIANERIDQTGLWNSFVSTNIFGLTCKSGAVSSHSLDGIPFVFQRSCKTRRSFLHRMCNYVWMNGGRYFIKKMDGFFSSFSSQSTLFVGFAFSTFKIEINVPTHPSSPSPSRLGPTTFVLLQSWYSRWELL